MLIGTIVDGLFEDWMQPETAINCQILGYHPICRQTQMFGFNHEIRLIWIKSEYIADITFKKQQYKDFIFWDSPTKNKKTTHIGSAKGHQLTQQKCHGIRPPLC